MSAAFIRPPVAEKIFGSVSLAFIRPCVPEKLRLACLVRTYKLACFELIWYLGTMMILNFMKIAYELFGYLIRFVWLLFCPKAVLAARLLAV